MCLGTNINLVVADWAAWSWSLGVWAVVNWGGVDITLTDSLTVSNIVVEVIEDGIVFIEVDGGSILGWYSTESSWVSVDLGEPVDLQGVEDLDWVLSLNNSSGQSILNLLLLDIEADKDIVSEVLKSPLEVIEGIIAVIKSRGSGLKDVILLFDQESSLIFEWCSNLKNVLVMDLL